MEDNGSILLLVALGGLVACYSMGSIIAIFPLALALFLGAYVLNIGD
jgi:hypothetical protein